MPDQPTVHIGEVWEDLTPDMGARRIKVTNLTEHKRDVFDGNLCRYVEERVQMAVCMVVRPNAHRKGSPRVVRIRIDRFRPTRTGFQLVAYACKPGECTGPETWNEELGADPADVRVWHCPHGRTFFWGEGGWEPQMTVEETAVLLTSTGVAL